MLWVFLIICVHFSYLEFIEGCVNGCVLAITLLKMRRSDIPCVGRCRCSCSDMEVGGELIPTSLGADSGGGRLVELLLLALLLHSLVLPRTLEHSTVLMLQATLHLLHIVRCPTLTLISYFLETCALGPAALGFKLRNRPAISASLLISGKGFLNLTSSIF